eukprot:COSAG04_NODE_19930_length_405_cov_0.509804_1_plen_65_part_01
MGVLFDGTEDEFNPWPWVGVLLGFVVGLVLGMIEADRDPTANHLAGHILTLQQDIFDETETNAVT